MRLEPMVPPHVDRLSSLWKARVVALRNSRPQDGPYLTEGPSWEARRKTYTSAFGHGAFGFLAHGRQGPTGYIIAARCPMERTATFALEPIWWEVLSVHSTAATPDASVEMVRRIEEIAADSDGPTVLIGALPGDKGMEKLCDARQFKKAWITLKRFGHLRPRSAASCHTIERHAIDDVERLRPLWISLHHHHQASAPSLGPFVKDDTSWQVVRELWRKSAEDGLLFVAWSGGTAIGVASAAVHTRAVMPVVSDLWATKDRIGETKFLVVDPFNRGEGVGTALMDEVDREFARRGIEDQIIGAIWGNTRAIAFYETRGFRPGWIEYVKRTREPLSAHAT